jgi:predicted transglutaminase-like cysteine proteinase
MEIRSFRCTLSCGVAAISALTLLSTSFSPTSRARHMSVGENALAPMKFIEFCLAKTQRCASTQEVHRVALDDAKRRELASVQETVDEKIAPVPDDPRPWRDDARSGDCVEYALAKRSRLLDMGWPASALLLAEAIVPTEEHHLVLVVVTEREDLILDNLRADVTPVGSLPYRWVRRSSPANPQFWQTVTFPKRDRGASES